MQNNLIERLGLDKDLVCEFLLCFSRFEYALKRAGFVAGDEREAKPAWDTFGDSLRGRFSSVTAPEFVHAVELLDFAPPQKQVLKDGQLGWIDNKKDLSESQEKWVLRLVRTVRNNLFHGGKYPGTIVPNPERDQQLLRACLTVLEHALVLSPKVKRWFSSEV
jgi:hypothetical protein